MLRLFVALRPPKPVADAMLGLLTGLDLPRHRPTPEGQVHLTAVYVGERADRERESAEASVEAGCRGIAPFELRPLRLAMLPEKGMKRTVVDICDRPPELLEMHRRLVQRFARDIRTAADTDRFLPHVTIARFSGAGVVVAPERRVDRPLDLPPFEVRTVHLMSSDLKPEGAEHRHLLELRLHGELVRR